MRTVITDKNIRKISFFPRFILKSLYYTLVYPCLTYCILAWGQVCTTTLNPIIVLQKKVVRIINGSDFYAHTNKIFNNLTILKLEYIFKYHCALFIYQIQNKNKALYMNEQIKNNQISIEYSLRNNGALRLPSVRVFKFKQSLIYQVSKLWNCLPNEIKLISSKNMFRKAVLTFFLNSQKNGL